MHVAFLKLFLTFDTLYFQIQRNSEFKMIFLTGNSLGERQKHLNEIVNKATEANTFDKYKTESGNHDIDNIFLIDLAAKCKNIDFILEILKSGDIVHITRALNKCTWLCDDECANIINVDNLQTHIFPLMSIKMKNKLLCMISINLKTASRSIDFYWYCMKERLFKIAMKFLFSTPESFKNDVILQKSEGFHMVLSNKEEALVNFIRNSFTLAEAFLDNIEAGQKRNDTLDLLRYMYSISGEQYFGLLEKYKTIEYCRHEPIRLGSRLSKEIIKKHKDRVLKNPLLYVHLLKKDKITKNSTINDVKVYAVPLLPDEATTFWNINFYEKYKFILDIIPEGERFCFIRKIFTEKYLDEEFEMSKQFYSLNFYNTMTSEEKQNWALRHIDTGEEILGSGNDYNWYKFVCFDKAFEEIKKYILITTDNEKRMKIIHVLIDSAKTQKEVETLLNYYYNRHVNELSHQKKPFLYKLIEKHNVFDFDEKCWIALEKIFYSLDVYTSKYIGANYREIALIYYILNMKTVPETLIELINTNIITVFAIKNCSRGLTPEKEDMIFQYLHKFYLKAVETSSCEDDVKTVARYITSYLDLLDSYSKTKDDIAIIMNKLMKDNWDQLKHHRLLRESGIVNFSERNIMQYMKKDATLVIDEFPLIKQYIQERFGRTNWLLKKLKIYFQHDIAKRYLQLLNDCLSADDVHYLMTKVAVYGLFKLAEESFKIEFMQKHVPTNPKIDHANISRNLLNIQQGICAYACVSRPPLPTAYIMHYLTGDYVHKCLPMFNYYLMNLPLPACISFVESVIDKPVSIQKHGLRLAFRCYSPENLKSLINDIWKRTKNISMRKILYKSLLDKVLKERYQTQLDLFEILNTLTLDLHQNDDNELFLLLCHSKMPNHLAGLHLVSGWKAVKKLPERSVNIERMTRVILSIEINVSLVPENEIITITNDHVSKMLDEKEILNDNTKDSLKELFRVKWELTLKHLTNVYNEMQLKNNLEVVRHIIKRCIEMRHEVIKGKLIMREFLWSFIKNLESKSFNCHKIESYSNMKIINDAILKDLHEALPEYEIFILTLELRLSDISRNIIISCIQESGKKLVTNATIRTCLIKFAGAFVVLLNEYIENGKYFASFHRKIEANIIKQLARVSRNIDINFTLNLKEDDLSILMCVGLLKYEITEVYLLIISLLPLDYSGNFISDYENTLCTVKAFKNNEVQYLMFEKFVNSDFMFRKQLFTAMV